LSEDEASRRIDVARLARRAPLVFWLIAEGRLSLSAAALLKPHIMSPMLAELIGAVSGKSVQAAREALASVFPRPDVAPGIRKLPAPVAHSENPSMVHVTQLPLQPGSAAEGAASTRSRFEHAPGVRKSTPRPPIPANQPIKPSRVMPPLSPGRYKVQFTADAALKQQLELARDLLRHTIPSGDLGAIMKRAVNLLVEDLMKRRFGAGARKNPASERPSKTEPTHDRAQIAPAANPPRADRSPPRPDTPQQPRKQASPGITRATRLAVAERDGLRCTWCGPDGTRCSARAWLELDHKVCRGFGGDSSVENLRLLCRAHNLRAAEHAYGERHIARAIWNRRLDGAHDGNHP
jgi:5-methylcytosine-specific restriction endonuclease McrA